MYESSHGPVPGNLKMCLLVSKRTLLLAAYFLPGTMASRASSTLNGHPEGKTSAKKSYTNFG